VEHDSVYFTAPKTVSVQAEPLRALKSDQVLVRTLLSAISAGTELLVYRGEFPQDLAVDESIQALQGDFSYPLKYGYSSVGQVIETGADISSDWMGRQVFAFQPHSSAFVSVPEALHPLPENVSPQDAVFLPNVETAVNLLMDGAPLVGEQVAIFGQGIVGLLTTALLSGFPLASLVTLDRYALRRRTSLNLGAHASFDPAKPGSIYSARVALQGPSPYAGADLVYELSGSPEALNQAIEVTGFNGRIVVGSWYGRKRAYLDLGGQYHRARMRMISSQVSSLSPHLSGRWTKARRFQVAWEALRRIQPSQFITHRYPLSQAERAYRQLDENPDETLQVVFTYSL
jgi:2-desacetyl-2-hydroxyethyl bacteriochlorophyllide A dehydrogenase